MQKVKSAKFYQRLSLNALFTQRAGQILSNEIPNVLNTQWNFGNGPIARLNILNLEYRNPSGLISSVKLGKLMQAQDFTVNRVQCFFSNFGLCGWAQATPQMVQIPGNPFNSYGAVLKIGPEDKTRLKYGVYQIAPQTYQPQYHGLNFRFDQAIGTAHFLELNIPLKSPTLIPVNTSLVPGYGEVRAHSRPNALYETPLPPTTLTVGGWLANGKFSVVQPSGLAPKFANQNNAVYGIASMRLPVSWLGMDNRVFAASSVGFNPDVQNFRSGGNAGVIIAGLLPTRPFDTFSLGTAYAVFNPSYYFGGLDASSYVPSSELAFEVNYNIAINQSVSIMPNYQYIVRPSGDSSRTGVSVLGVQVWVRF
jgi:carbohydrate-selective porin OprB